MCTVNRYQLQLHDSHAFQKQDDWLWLPNTSWELKIVSWERCETNLRSVNMWEWNLFGCMLRICQQIESFSTFTSIKQHKSAKWVLPRVGGPLCPLYFLGTEWPPAPETPGPDQGSEDLEGPTEHQETYNKNMSCYDHH